MIRSLRHILAVLLIMVAAGAAAGVAPAATKGATPCWKVLINDWYDGRIDGTYPIHCYRDALKHLPSDVDTYSSARDDIQQALQERITQSRRNHNGTTTTTGQGGGSSGGGSNGGGSNGGGPSSGGTRGGGSKGGGDAQASGPFGDAINSGKPAKADSLPVPLLVLGGVALLLMAAGAAGFLARRSRLRRLQMASATSVPHGSGAERPERR